MELFTATWCGPCYNADLAADEIRETYSNDEVILLEYHYEQSDDPFFTPGTNYRFNQYYDFDSWPSAMFDGNIEEVGSGEVDDVYDRYEQHVESRLSEKSHFYIKMLEPTYDGKSGYIRSSISEQTESGRENITIFTVIFRDKLTFDGGNGITEHRYVVRKVFTEEFDKPSKVVDYEFTLPDDSQYMENGDNVGIAVFVQDDDTKEVLQAQLHQFFSINTTNSDEDVIVKDDSSWMDNMSTIAPIIIAVGMAIVASLIMMKRPGRTYRKGNRPTKEFSTTHGSSTTKRGSKRTGGGAASHDGKNKHGSQKNSTGKGGHDESYALCPECNVKLKTHNLKSHLDRVHGN